MSVRSFSELGTLFANQSTDLWERLGYVRESYKSRGVLGPVRFGEETITDLLMMDLYVQGSRLAHFKQTSKQEESLWGTDFELWLGSGRLGWFRFAIQAKKLDLKSDRYASLTQANANGIQIDVLEQFARLNRAAPLYCLYNHSEDADEFDHWHCCTGPADLRELGCSVTPSSNIRTAIGQWKGKNFKSIHRRKCTLPWKCLGCVDISPQPDESGSEMKKAQISGVQLLKPGEYPPVMLYFVDEAFHQMTLPV